MQVDWGLLKVLYEINGEEIPTLADEFGIAPSLIEYAAAEGEWQRLPLADATRDWRDLDQLEAVGDELIDEVTKRLRIMRTIKQSALSPQYIALESALLNKAMQLIQAIDPTQPGAATQLKTVSDMVAGLQEKNNGSTGAAGGDEAGSRGFTVQVLAQVGCEGQGAKAGAQVEVIETVPVAPGSVDAITTDAS